MLDRLFSNPTMLAMEKALDGAAVRQSVTANNIANVDTPNYKNLEVTFEDQLREALNNQNDKHFKLTLTNPRHMQIHDDTPSIREIKPQVTELKDYALRNDKNNVDIEREMAKIEKNEIYYNAVASMLSEEYKQLFLVITGRR